jgi:hypothetical protein
MVTKECLLCSDEFDVIASREDSAKFCSRDCYHEAQRQGITEHSERRVEYIEIECTGCGKEVEKPPSRANRSERQFCNKDCYHEWSKSHQKDQTGRRERLREKENMSCEICGFSRFLELSHIVPSRDGGTYHKSNILFLCPNHHRLLDHGGIKKEEILKVENKLRSSVCDGYGWVSPK